MSKRLTSCDKLGNWGLKGVSMMSLIAGNVITKDIEERLYGALYKLHLYENILTSPDKLETIYALVDKLRERCSYDK